MNVALTSYCNQKCLYCFGSDAMSFGRNTQDGREISAKNLNKVMGFMKKSGVSIFNMIGGEPTLHSKFEGVYDTISDNGFSVMLFSNGIIDERRVEFLRKKDNLVDILININHPKDYSSKHWAMVNNALSRLNKKITLSFRVYELNFDPRFLFELIDKYKLMRLINWAIACPSLIKDNIYIKLEDHEKVIKRMVRFSRESKKRNIRWYSDSGFISCAFGNGKLKELYHNIGFKPVINCLPPIEVSPNLRVFRCLGLAPKSHPDLKLTDFKNLGEAERYFFVKSLPFKKIGGMDRCFKCKDLISGKCGGGCLVHILKKFPDYKNLPPIFDTKRPRLQKISC